MSKKKKIIIVLAILLTIAVSFFGGQTFSKYTTEIRGSGNAEVAAWSFRVYGDNEQTQNVKLVSTVNDETLVGNKIAPGTKGSFVIKIDGRGSDVGIKYNLKLQNETQKPSNLLYTYAGMSYDNLADLLQAAGGTIDANAEEARKVKEIVVKWVWPYETKITSSEVDLAKEDQQDTQDGENISNYSFDIVVTGTQVIPNATNG